MNVSEVFRFMDGERLGVLSTATNSGRPEAALMGFAVTPGLEIVFDTVRSSRKYPILKENPRVAWVVGCTTEITVQYEGEAKELEGEELARYKKIYFEKFPDGPARENWPGMTYFVVRPKWVRFCDYNVTPRRIEERSFDEEVANGGKRDPSPSAAPDKTGQHVENAEKQKQSCREAQAQARTTRVRGGRRLPGG